MSVGPTQWTLLVAAVPAGIATFGAMCFLFGGQYVTTKKQGGKALSTRSVAVQSLPSSPPASEEIVKSSPTVKIGGEKAPMPILVTKGCHRQLSESSHTDDNPWYNITIPPVSDVVLFGMQARVILDEVRDAIYHELRAIVNVRRPSYARLSLVNEGLSVVEKLILTEGANALIQIREVTERATQCDLSALKSALCEVRQVEKLSESFSLGVLFTYANYTKENELRSFRKRLLAKVAKTPEEFSKRLSPFACFLIGRFLGAEAVGDAELPAVVTLLEQSIAHVVMYPVEVPQFPVQTSLPFGDAIPFYAPYAFLQLAQLLEKLETQPPLQSHAAEQVQKVLCNDGRPHSLQMYQRALELSNGNSGSTWRAVGIALGNRGVGSIHVFGELVTASQCFAEAIRCSGGRRHCTDSTMWRDAASSLRCLLSTDEMQNEVNTVSGNVGEFIFVTSRCNEPFVFNQRYRQPEYATLSKAACLVESLNHAEEPSYHDFADWRNLALCLSSCVEQYHTPDGPHWLLRQERVVVRGNLVTRLDCLRQVLQLDPTVATTWYHAALAMEDDVVIRAKGATAEEEVYRQVLCTNKPPMGRVEALCIGLSYDTCDVRLWFALGVALFRRSSSLVQPEEWMATITLQAKEEKKATEMNDIVSYNDYLNTIQDEKKRAENVVVVMDEEEEEEEEKEEPTVTIRVNASDCFDKCRRIDPDMAGVVDRWLQEHNLGTSEEH